MALPALSAMILQAKEAQLPTASPHLFSFDAPTQAGSTIVLLCSPFSSGRKILSVLWEGTTIADTLATPDDWANSRPTSLWWEDNAAPGQQFTVQGSNFTGSSVTIQLQYHIYELAGVSFLESDMNGDNITNFSPRIYSPLGISSTGPCFICGVDRSNASYDPYTLNPNFIGNQYGMATFGTYHSQEFAGVRTNEQIPYTVNIARRQSAIMAIFQGGTSGPPPVHPLSGFSHPLGRPGRVS